MLVMMTVMMTVPNVMLLLVLLCLVFLEWPFVFKVQALHPQVCNVLAGDPYECEK